MILAQNVVHGAGKQTVLVTNHCVGFACAGLTVGQNASTSACQHRVDDWQANLLKEKLLVVFLVLEDVIEGEIPLLEVSPNS